MSLQNLNLFLFSTTWRIRLIIVLIVATVVSVSGISSKPLEAHEAFVLVAAQHMIDQQDWILPWFNGEHRLNKPPMNYWLTAFFAWLAIAADEIQPWHGRLVSGLAGVGLVAITMHLGRRFWSEQISLLAGIMLACSTGYYNYTHSARPEMLYAFFCAVSLMAYFFADDYRETRKHYFSELIWIAFGCAMMTKGPQLPALFLVAMCIDLRLKKLNAHQILTILKPLRGSIILMIIVLPWAILLYFSVPKEELFSSQVAGQLLAVDHKKGEWLYYAYRPLQLMLPWALAIPVILVYEAKKWPKKIKVSQPTQLLVLLVLICAIGLSFAPQKRWYYMLPTLMPMFLLLSIWIHHLFTSNLINRKIWKISMYLTGLIVLSFLGLIQTTLMEKNTRLQEMQLVKDIQTHTQHGYSLITLNITPEIYVYYTKKQVLDISDLSLLKGALETYPSQSALLLLKKEALANMPDSIQFKIIETSHIHSSYYLLLVSLSKQLQS